MTIFFTGDTHGKFTRFNSQNFIDQKKLTKEDYLIICGDFSGVWDGSRQDKYNLDWLESKNFTTLFVDGNHENFDLLNQYKSEEWNGGRVHKLRGNVIHLIRGQVFNINDKKIFTFGGAQSHDISDGILDTSNPYWKDKARRMRKEQKLFRVSGVSWWKEELPTHEEMREGLSNLCKHNFEVDYIVTHSAPTNIQLKIDSDMNQYETNILTDYLQEIDNLCKFDGWYFGHYHNDRNISDKYHMLYNNIVEGKY